jgi:DNA-directed RNA polymerase subunit RPC12/RpoP
MSQQMFVHCKDCGKEVAADEAYHAKHRGFLCGECHDRAMVWGFVLAAIMVVVIMVIGAASGR